MISICFFLVQITQYLFVSVYSQFPLFTIHFNTLRVCCISISLSLLGQVAQSVAILIADAGVVSLIIARSHTS